VPPDFLDVEGDTAAEVHRRIFFAHAKALVVFEGLKRSAVVAHVFEAPLDYYEVLVDQGVEPNTNGFGDESRRASGADM
jgi:hypothetical protein